MTAPRLKKPPACPAAKGAGSGAVRVAELCIEALKVLAWPCVAIVAFFAFYAQLQDIASGVATKMREADKVTIGSLSLEIKERVREVSNDALAEQVGKLTPQAIEQLLRIADGNNFSLFSSSDDQKALILGVPQQVQLNAIYELEKRGFLKFSLPAEPLVKRVRALPLEESSHHGGEYTWHRPPFTRSSAEFKELFQLHYGLTTNGIVARAAIIKSVSALIAPRPPPLAVPAKE